MLASKQRADHCALRRGPCRRPLLQTFQDVGRQPTSDQVEHPAIADLRLDPRHETIVRDRIEVAGEVGVHHEGVAVLDQPVDHSQRVVASASRTEAVALVPEPRLENRFDHEPNRLLDDAILDRGNPQRSRLAIALRDFDPFDGLRSVRALPQRRGKLGQIDIRPRPEPFDALPIHARRAVVGPDFLPGLLQRRGRVHLVDQCVPFAALDAVAQRRQHAFLPNRGFGPREISVIPGLSVLSSYSGTPGGVLLRSKQFASPFLPPLPRSGFASRSSHGPSFRDKLHRYYEGSDSCPTRTRRTGLSAYVCLAFRTSNPQPRTGPERRFRSRLIALDGSYDPGFAIHEEARRAIPPKRVCHPTGCSFASSFSPPRLAATQLLSASCNTTSHRSDFHLPDKTVTRSYSWPGLSRPSTSASLDDAWTLSTTVRRPARPFESTGENVCPARRRGWPGRARP